MVRLAEIRLAGFLARHNLHLAAADRFIHSICSSFANSDTEQAFGKESTIQTPFFNLASDASNGQNLQKMNPATVGILYINYH